MAIFYYCTFFIAYFFSMTAFIFAHFGDVAYTSKPYNFVCLLMAAFLYGEYRKRNKLSALYLIGTAVFVLLPIAWDRNFFGIIQLLFTAILLIMFNVRSVEPYDYMATKRLFKGLTIGYALVIVLQGFGASQSLLALELMVPYVVIFLASGFMILQILRFRDDTADKERFIKRQFVEGIMFFAVSILLTVFRVAQLFMNAVYMVIIRPVFNAVAAVITNMLKVKPVTIPLLHGSDLNSEYVDSLITAKALSDEPEVEPVPFATEQQEPKEINWAFVAIALVVIILIIMLIIILTAKKKGISAPSIATEEIKDVKATHIPEKKKLTKEEKGMRDRYKDYMKRVNAKEKLSVADTTSEINDKYLMHENTENLVSAANDFTKAYQEVRYAEKIMTLEEFKKAKEDYKRLK